MSWRFSSYRRDSRVFTPEVIALNGAVASYSW